MKNYTLITGATSGIGYELAKIFAEKKYDLILVARNEQNLKEIEQDFTKRYGISVHIVAADLSVPDAAQTLFNTLKDFPIDILVNNAGYAAYGAFIENDFKTIIGSIRLNVETVTSLTKLLLPQIINSKGKILNVASTAAFQPGPLMAVYYATKAYVLSFSEALRYELKNTGVIVTTLCPGATDTAFQEKANFGNSNLVKMGMMKADVVAYAGYQGLMKGKSIVIPGLKNKFGAFLIRLSPRNLVLRIVNGFNTTRQS